MNVYISGVYLSASINKHVVAISTPIKDEYSQLTGVWLGALTLDVLSEKVKNLTFGRTGKIYLVDKNGVIAAHPNKEFTSKITKLDKHPSVTKLRMDNPEQANKTYLWTIIHAFVLPYCPYGLKW